MICSARRRARSSVGSSARRSRPSKSIAPEVGSIRHSINRPVVDLPQPDSPTSASVSPSPTSKSMPSTARTAPLRPPKMPLLTGKYLTRFATRSNGFTPAPALRCVARAEREARCPGRHYARYAAVASRRHQHIGVERRAPACAHVFIALVQERRILLPAAVDRERAAWMKATAGHGIHRIGHEAFDRRQPLLLEIESWNRSEQADRIRVLRLREQRLDARMLDDAPGVHDRYLVGELGDDAQIVRDQDDRRARFLAQRAHEVEDLRLDRHVECCGRLVGDKKVGLAGERHRDHDALAHAAGEPVRIVVEAPLGRWDVHAAQHLDRSFPRGGARQRPVAQYAFGDLFADGECRVERSHRLLEDHRQAVTAKLAHLGCGKLREIDALETYLAIDASGGRGDEAHDRERGNALAAAGFADDGERVASVERKADAVDRGELAGFDRERRPELAYLEQRAFVCPHACGCRRCAAPGGGAIRALGRPCGSHRSWRARSVWKRSISASILARSVMPAGRSRPGRHATNGWKRSRLLTYKRLSSASGSA